MPRQKEGVGNKLLSGLLYGALQPDTGNLLGIFTVGGNTDSSRNQFDVCRD